ncbi:hypothetical protein BDA96_10G061600 [Sorghum bicolor]|uniref:Uncharacterized protein n=2 Tax=Sorghum bicolor TaxID=4558 RepID=A0A921TZT3_SORBI|nr:hypothetical protein BDA96_10G061600 [Sorghum bicolor]OQU75891.1 hypothetical protein SORBI_3010G052450 [Sorghum bicolor]
MQTWRRPHHRRGRTCPSKTGGKLNEASRSTSYPPAMGLRDVRPKPFSCASPLVDRRKLYSGLTVVDAWTQLPPFLVRDLYF